MASTWGYAIGKWPWGGFSALEGTPESIILKPDSVDPPPAIDPPSVTFIALTIFPASVDPPPTIDPPSVTFAPHMLLPSSVPPPPAPSKPRVTIGELIPTDSVVQYTVGTIELTTGSSTVVGIATGWLLEVAVSHDLIVLAPGEPAADLVYPIAAVVGDEELTLAAPWPGPDLEGVPYAVHRNYDARGIPRFKRTTLGIAQLWNRAMLLIDADLP